MLKKILLAATLAILPVSAFAQSGAFPNYPTVGVPATTECMALGNNGVCTQYRPAGPTTMTGIETVPADTNLTGGQQPQTVRVPVMELGSGKFQLSVPVVDDTITLDAATRQLVVNPAGTLARMGVTLPAASATTPYNGARVGVCGTQIVTTLTMTAGTGNTFNPTPPTAMLVPVVTGGASCFEFIYSKTSATAGVWFRAQ